MGVPRPYLANKKIIYPGKHSAAAIREHLTKTYATAVLAFGMERAGMVADSSVRCMWYVHYQFVV